MWGEVTMIAETLDRGRRARGLLALAVVLAVTGCASIRRNEAASTEELLAAAGFQMRPADTPERLAELNSLPRQKFVTTIKDGNVVYTYADPDKCHCLYVGGQREYSVYDQLKINKEIATDEAEATIGYPWSSPWWW